MPVNYDQIRNENITRYGTDTALLDLLGQLYSERTHFIFEILQNAEDADASVITFELFEDRLEVRHDGRPFTEADVRGICGVGKGAKGEDLTKIGKFGIGFKSVYAYTRNPQVHSSGEHFRIKNYVRPSAVDPVAQGSEETLFIFPFDCITPAPSIAVEQISRALSELAMRTLLFLRSLKQIHVRGVDTADTVFERSTTSATPSRRQVRLRESSASGNRDEEWLVWHRGLEAVGYPAQRVEIAFEVRSDDEGTKLAELHESPLVVFFPTERETGLGFLMQGPYRTTPARDNVPHHDATNRALVRETGKLLHDVLLDTRDCGLLTVDVLDAMPLDEEQFQPDSMFRSLYEAVRDVLRAEALIPLAGGGFGACETLRLARGAGLRDLLTPMLLGEFHGEDRPLTFASDVITENRTPRLWRYLRQDLDVGEVTPEWVVGRLTAALLARQPDAWVVKLYAFLHQLPALWREPRTRWESPGLVRVKPVIRLEGGSHVLPFDGEGAPSAYLPGITASGFPTVRRAVAENPEARQFLEDLKFTEPDATAEVLENILPRYADADAPEAVDLEQHHADLEMIERALNEAAGQRREHLIAALRQSSFLIGASAATGEPELKEPTALYLGTPRLRVFFEGNPDAWFLDEEKASAIRDVKVLGVRGGVPYHARKADPMGHVTVDSIRGWHRRGLDRFDPAATIDGLEFALNHPTPERSAFVWNVLLPELRHLLTGTVEKCSRANFSDSEREEVISPIGHAARSAAWLPDSGGSFHRPSELSLNDLPSGYSRDEHLAKALGMVRPILEEASRQLGVDPEVIRLLQANPALGARMLEQERTARELRARSAFEVAKGEAVPDGGDGGGASTGETSEYVQALRDAFQRPGCGRDRSAEVGPVGEDDAVSNPGLRRERVRDEIDEGKSTEPPRDERFDRVPRRIWEAKDSAVRHFLIEQYEGRCQICSSVFARRDGAPYFEGLYLVSRTCGRWVDRPGNVICLCATCCAKFQHGPVDAADIIRQIMAWRTNKEGGNGDAALVLSLCHDVVRLKFTEKHMLDLQEIVRAEVESYV